MRHKLLRRSRKDGGIRERPAREKVPQERATPAGLHLSAYTSWPTPLGLHLSPSQKHPLKLGGKDLVASLT